MTAADRAQKALREMILSGTLRTGQRLKEEAMASIVGVSRTPVREALVRLEGEGLVTFKSNVGAVVATWSIEDAEAIFELRAEIEAFGAKLAAEHADGERISALSALADRMESDERSGDSSGLKRVAELNNEFHRMVMELSGNLRLVVLQQNLIQTPLILQTFHKYSGDQLRRSFNHHRELIDALASNDGAWAESVMRAHIFSARNVLRAGVENQQ